MDSYTALFDKTIDLYIESAGKVAMRNLSTFANELFVTYRGIGWDSWDDSKHLHLLDIDDGS